MAMSLRIRQQVLRRDKFTCQMCGRTANDGVKLEVDHRRPMSQGGSDDLENLWTLCDACNSGKGDRWDDSLAGNPRAVSDFSFEEQDLEFIAMIILEPDLQSYLRTAFFEHDLLELPSPSGRSFAFSLVVVEIVDNGFTTLPSYWEEAHAMHNEAAWLAKRIRSGRHRQARDVVLIRVREELLLKTRDYVNGLWGAAFSEPDFLTSLKDGGANRDLASAAQSDDPDVPF